MIYTNKIGGVTSAEVQEIVNNQTSAIQSNVQSIVNTQTNTIQSNVNNSLDTKLPTYASGKVVKSKQLGAFTGASGGGNKSISHSTVDASKTLVIVSFTSNSASYDHSIIPSEQTNNSFTVYTYSGNYRYMVLEFY